MTNNTPSTRTPLFHFLHIHLKNPFLDEKVPSPFIFAVHPYLKFSVSATTREMRINEQDGVDYNFLEINNFKNKINNGEFIEYEEVYHNVFYGTLKSDVKKLLQNHNLIFDVDVVGAISLKKYFSDSVTKLPIDKKIGLVFKDIKESY